MIRFFSAPLKRFALPALAALAAVCALSALGCGELIFGPPADLFELSPKTSYPEGLPEIPAQLVIAEPTAGRALDTDRIALKPIPEQFQYYSNARWTNRSPLMVQTLLVESFENTGKMVSVGREAIKLRPDYTLISELREFQAEYFHTEAKPMVAVRLNAKLIDIKAGRIVASETFESMIPVERDTMLDVIRAFDLALGKVIKKTVVWSLDAIASELAAPEN